MIGYKTINDKKLSIFKNIFINNGNVTAYYILHPYNYSVMDFNSSGRHIDLLYKTINNLYSSFGEIKMSMFKLKNIISKEETINSIVETVKMYDKNYKDFPEKYKNYIKNISKDFTILAININTNNNFDIENQSLKFIIKNTIDNFVKSNFSTTIADVDEEAISSTNVRIANTIKRYAIPANPKLVMNIYVNSLFPSYNLIYNDYLLNNSVPILANIKQEIIPHLGWFEMSNSGIVAFGGKQRKTYGSILTILKFPEQIQSENFNIYTSGLNVNMNLLEKDKALLKFKRMRADVNQEMEEAIISQTSDSDIHEDKFLVQNAIKDIRNGRIIAEVDANILVIAESKEELDEKKKHIISILSDINVVCSISDNQAKTFINSFVKHKPNNYYHMMDLQYALSFQIDSGVMVGDQDSKFAAPVIGIS